MTCDDVQDRLSEYLDRRLDGETRRSVEEHLSSCPDCQSVAESLSHTIQLLASEPEVDPPFGMRTRLMARLDEAENKRSVWEWFSMPFRINLPIQAAAVVVVAVLAVFLYNKETPRHEGRDNSLPPTGSANTNAQLAEESKQKGQAQGVEELTSQTQRPEAGSGREYSRVGAEVAIDYQLVLRLRVPEGGGSSNNPLRSQPGPGSVLSERDLKKLDQARQRAIQTGQSQSETISISRGQYEQFKKELEAIGNIESDSPSPSSDKTPAGPTSAEKLTILVTIKPAQLNAR